MKDEFIKFPNPRKGYVEPDYLVLTLLVGFHATVFAYGATGAGKTFTMVGTPEHPGCMVRALNELYETMDKASAEAVFKGFHVQSKI